MTVSIMPQPIYAKIVLMVSNSQWTKRLVQKLSSPQDVRNLPFSPILTSRLGNLFNCVKDVLMENYSLIINVMPPIKLTILIANSISLKILSVKFLHLTVRVKLSVPNVKLVLSKMIKDFAKASPI